jgi:hypothetical protein
MSDDDLDKLYSVKPDGFTALRRKLTDAAWQRGDAAAATRISAVRKPTTAAWIVNLLVLQRKEIKQRLGDLGVRLRDAHAAMDGERIRRLSTEQRHIVDELVRAAFQGANVKNPSAAVREDVTGTLQAAIADSGVTAELGRLSKAERWSGFGGFGAAATVSTTRRAATAKSADTTDDTGAAPRRAESQLADAKKELAAARRRYDETRRNVEHAERDLKAATEIYDKAKQVDREAAASFKEAQARLRQRRSKISEWADRSAPAR